MSALSDKREIMLDMIDEDRIEAKNQRVDQEPAAMSLNHGEACLISSLTRAVCQGIPDDGVWVAVLLYKPDLPGLYPPRRNLKCQIFIGIFLDLINFNLRSIKALGLIFTLLRLSALTTFSR